MGAVQAQDYGQSLWAIASRMRVPDLGAVVRSIEDRRIVRTWPMRGTVHWVPTQDAAWMVALSAERTLRAAARRRQDLELTDEILISAERLLTNALSEEGDLSRPEVMALWEAHGVRVHSGRGYHLLWALAHRGQIVIGPMRGKQQTFVLLDDFSPPASRTTPRDGAAELASRYLTSHGPATAQDLAWWMGVTLTVARQAIAEAETAGRVVSVPGERPELWTGAAPPVGTEGALPIRLLAGFDEYCLGYTTRDDVLRPEDFTRVVPGKNGVFLGTIVREGAIVGTWRRTLRAKTVDLELETFPGVVGLPGTLEDELDRYSQAVALPLGRVTWAQAE